MSIHKNKFNNVQSTLRVVFGREHQRRVYLTLTANKILLISRVWAPAHLSGRRHSHAHDTRLFISKSSSITVDNLSWILRHVHAILLQLVKLFRILQVVYNK